MKKKIVITGGIKFLIATLLLYVFVAFFDSSFAKMAFDNFLFMFVRIIPLLIIVFVVMVFTNVYFTEDRMYKYLGAGSGMRGWLYAIISGIIISGPPYILYPLLGTLKEKGMKTSLMAVFLFNRNVKIPFVPVMIYYFGLGFTMILSIYIILFSILNGIIVSKFSSYKTSKITA